MSGIPREHPNKPSHESLLHTFTQKVLQLVIYGNDPPVRIRLCASSQATLKRQQGTQCSAIKCPSEPAQPVALASHASCPLFWSVMAYNLTYSRTAKSSDRAVLILCAHNALVQGKDEKSRMVPCPAWRAWSAVSAEPSHAQSSTRLSRQPLDRQEY